MRPNKKICVFPVTCFLKLGWVGKISFLFFEVLFIITELVYLRFSVCHVVSRLVAPSFSLVNSLISADLLSAEREGYKSTVSKVSFNKKCNKNRLESENIFCEKNQLQTTKKEQ